MEFVALDVETANADMASICQIGIARFADGKLSGQWESYVDPQDFFDWVNISIHGITEATIAGAPTFNALAGTIKREIGERIVVTHTAFDRVALYQATAKWGTSPLSCTWLDSACVARRAWNQFAQRGYGLQNVCNTIGYTFKHHDALEDAKAAGIIVLAAIAETGMDLSAWLQRVRKPIDPAYQDRITRHGNPEGELHGEVLVFTGALSMPRREAADLAANAGCQVDASVTKRTTILVVGDQDAQMLHGHDKSAKHRKAEELILEGHAIRILRETDFGALIKLSETDD